MQRKKDEKIHIRDDIVITVIAIQGQRVQIGIEAPPEVRILRKEIWEIEKAKQTFLNKPSS